MQEVGAFEAKNTLGTLLDRVERGEEIVITRHGRPVARLVPNSPSINTEDALAAIQELRDLAKAQHFGPFDWEEEKKDRDEGRL